MIVLIDINRRHQFQDHSQDFKEIALFYIPDQHADPKQLYNCLQSVFFNTS